MWPLAAILAPFTIPPLGSIICAALIITAVVLLVKESPLGNMAKISVLAFWLSAIACLVYAIIAFGSMVEAADNISPDPSWTQGFLPAILVGIIALVASSFIVLRGERTRAYV